MSAALQLVAADPFAEIAAAAYGVVEFTDGPDLTRYTSLSGLAQGVERMRKGRSLDVPETADLNWETGRRQAVVARILHADGTVDRDLRLLVQREDFQTIHAALMGAQARRP